MLKLGSTDIADMKLGTTQVLKAYLGTTLVWEKEEPGPDPIPVPSPGPYLTTLTSVQEGATVTMTWKGGSVTGTGTVSADITAGTFVTYTVTLGDKTETNTVVVIRPTNILIDLEVEKARLVVHSLTRQEDGYTFDRFYVRVIYPGYDATFLCERYEDKPIYFPNGTNITFYLSDPMFACARLDRTSVSRNVSYSVYQNGILTVNFTPTDADIFVHDQLNNLLPPITMDKVNGVATFYNCNFVSRESTITVVAKKAGYADKSVSYTPVNRADKTVTINL